MATRLDAAKFDTNERGSSKVVGTLRVPFFVANGTRNEEIKWFGPNRIVGTERVGDFGGVMSRSGLPNSVTCCCAIPYASNFFTTSPCTSVSRKSRPWKR